MKLLEQLTQLSHEFGTAEYVCAGGGNTSAKDDGTLWVKPSGTTLLAMKPDAFVAMDRARLWELFSAAPSAHESVTTEIIRTAVRPGSVGRPSVEAPLHESFRAIFVVHTHPAIVNGMTCAMHDRQICEKLFPEAIWFDYIDPGLKLCVHVRDRINKYADEIGRQPNVVFLQNHGVFVAGDSPEEVRLHHDEIMDRLRAEYLCANLPTEIETGEMPPDGEVEIIRQQLRETIGDDAAYVCAAGPFDVATGPITPDHVVYAKSHPLMGEPTEEAVRTYRDKYGYSPRVVSCESGVFGLGRTEKEAQLALELTRDGALVKQLARAFGGIRYMSAAAGEFIENWEAEEYRRQQL